MKITFATLNAKSIESCNDTLVFPIADHKNFSAQLQSLDKKAGGVIKKAVAASGFTAKKGKTLTVAMPAAVKCHHVVLVGKETGAKSAALGAEHLGGALVGVLNGLRAKSATLVVEEPKAKAGVVAAHMASGALLKNFFFDKYFTKKKADEKPTFHALTVLSHDAAAAKAEFAELEKIADGVFLTRNLVSEPANVLYPESFAAECKKLSALGVDVRVLSVKEMEKLGMGALLGVGQGSAKESKLVAMVWNGDARKNKQAPVAFVGKGVCFDTGGISIKPAGGMEEMKWDMGGAGVVTGLMKALAGRKAKVNAVGVVGLVENMPDGNAQRPGDVVKSMSGQTIEVLNTDAEGRLVLADVLWYAQEQFKPKAIVDLATLTGAIIVALGSSRAGVFSNDDTLSERLIKSGEAVGEPMWRLPLGEEYDEQINSDIADMQNIGKEREAGSITAAQFLQRFIQHKTPWAHLDIAGVAWSKKPGDLHQKGATAWGVRMLDRLVREYYE